MLNKNKLSCTNLPWIALLQRARLNFCTALCFLSEELQWYKSLLRIIPSNITNNSFCNSTPVWIQACLLMRQGGQHIRSAAQDANSTSLASAAGSSHLVSQFLPSHLHKVRTCSQRRSVPVFIPRAWHPSSAKQSIPLPKRMRLPKSQSCFLALFSDVADTLSHACLWPRCL